MENTEMETLFTQSSERLARLHSIVQKAVQEEQLIVDKLQHPEEEKLNAGQKISDKVARFGGSWKFIISFGIVLAVWIVFNSVMVVSARFDPYPFILMNLILSCVAALQAPVIMMSQNRKEEKDRMRSENDYLVNLKAELEIRSLHQKVDMLLEDEMKTLFATQEKQYELMKELVVKMDALAKKAD